MTYKNILQKGAFAALMTAGLVMTVSCNDDDIPCFRRESAR